MKKKIHQFNEIQLNLLKYFHSIINIHYISQFNLASCFQVMNRLVYVNDVLN